MTDETLSQTAALQNEFRANRAAILACERGDYTQLLPGYDSIPEHLRFERAKKAMQERISRQVAIVHALQTASTGPRKKTAGSPAEKAKAAETARTVTANILSDLDL